MGKIRMQHRNFINSIGRCELCGSTRNLQLHHLIPLICGNDNIDLDVEDNWLVVCSSCHDKLTPTNILTRFGISKVKESSNKKVMDFYSELNDICESGERLDIEWVLDIFDKHFSSGKENADG